MDANIHRVTKVVISKIDERDMGGKPYFVRELKINNEDGRVIDITLFSDDKEALKISTVEEKTF